MGVHFDLILADKVDTELLKRITVGDFDGLPVFFTKMLDPTTLDSLFSLMNLASPYREAWYETPLHEEDDVLALYAVPGDFVKRLAGLSEVDQQILARRWTDSGDLDIFYEDKSQEEMAADIAKLMNEICSFSAAAIQSNKRMFLVITL